MPRDMLKHTALALVLAACGLDESATSTSTPSPGVHYTVYVHGFCDGQATNLAVPFCAASSDGDLIPGDQDAYKFAALAVEECSAREGQIADDRLYPPTIACVGADGLTAPWSCTFDLRSSFRACE